LEQEILLSELPTMKLVKPSLGPPGGHKSEIQIAKLNVGKSLDYVEKQNFDITEFQQIEEYIFERLDQIRARLDS